MNEHEVIARGHDTPAQVTTSAYTVRWLFNGALTPGVRETLGFVVIQPGQKNPLHAHPNCEEVLYLVSGELDHTIDGAVFRLEPGDAVRVPAAARHDARAVGPDPATMVVFYNVPDREMVTYE
jgi:mannose-6-phosphate isomerase-like protein (cupin superfamily)